MTQFSVELGSPTPLFPISLWIATGLPLYVPPTLPTRFPFYSTVLQGFLTPDDIYDSIHGCPIFFILLLMLDLLSLLCIQNEFGRHWKPVSSFYGFLPCSPPKLPVVWRFNHRSCWLEAAADYLESCRGKLLSGYHGTLGLLRWSQYGPTVCTAGICLSVMGNMWLQKYSVVKWFKGMLPQTRLASSCRVLEPKDGNMHCRSVADGVLCWLGSHDYSFTMGFHTMRVSCFSLAAISYVECSKALLEID